MKPENVNLFAQVENLLVLRNVLFWDFVTEEVDNFDDNNNNNDIDVDEELFNFMVSKICQKRVVESHSHTKEQLLQFFFLVKFQIGSVWIVCCDVMWKFLLRTFRTIWIALVIALESIGVLFAHLISFSSCRDPFFQQNMYHPV